MISSDALIDLSSSSSEDGSFPLMLRSMLFTPAAAWLGRALECAGIERFLILVPEKRQSAFADCFPPGARFCDPESPELKETVRSFAANAAGEILTIIRPVWLSFTGAGILTHSERLPEAEEEPFGIFRVPPARLLTYQTKADLESGAVFSPAADSAPLAFPLEDETDLFSVQDLAKLDYIAFLMQHGVRTIDPASVYVDPTVTIGRGTVLLPGTILRGKTVIGENCEIGPDTVIRDCVLGCGCSADASRLYEARFGNGVTIGPFTYVRPGTDVADGCKVGDFVEVKNSTIGDGTKLPHLIYVGDADVGKHCNFGCGTVTCNYDGKQKYRTTVGDNVFLGCNTNLVAPVTVGSGAYTAAGSTVTRDVPEDALAVARERQTCLSGWAKRRRECGQKEN